MNVLITGGCGFIGSNFINSFFNKYPSAYIVNLDILTYCSKKTNVDENIRNSTRYKFIKGDIKNKYTILNILDLYNINFVIHFAAQTHVDASFNDSINYSQDNFIGTHTLLECCRINNKKCKIEKIIIVSTDEVYGESQLDDTIKKTEKSLLCPTNPYSATKAAAESIANSYLISFNLPIIITRGNNTYGPHQHEEKLIPRFISQLKNNECVTIQGDGTSIRDFLHVSDTVNAFLVIFDKGVIGEIYNIGCDDGMGYTVMDIAYKLIFMIKNTTNYDKYITYVEDRPFNDKRYYISNDKIKKLGWTINVSFEYGLNKLLQ